MNKSLLKQLETKLNPPPAGDPLLICTHGNLECFEGGDETLFRDDAEDEQAFVTRGKQWGRRLGHLVLVGRPRVPEL